MRAEKSTKRSRSNSFWVGAKTNQPFPWSIDHARYLASRQARGTAPRRLRSHGALKLWSNDQLMWNSMWSPMPSCVCTTKTNALVSASIVRLGTHWRWKAGNLILRLVDLAEHWAQGGDITDYYDMISEKNRDDLAIGCRSAITMMLLGFKYLPLNLKRDSTDTTNHITVFDLIWSVYGRYRNC
jgi:hypothetical protein